MKVFLLGATGNLGSRLVPALLTHGHSVVAYVRSSNKLESLLPAAVYQQINVVQGDAKDADAIKKAILDSKCDAVINAAGLAAAAPWASSDLPEIFRAVLKGVREASAERKAPLRVWFLGGQGVLYYPNTQTPLTSYLPVYLEHGPNLQLLRSLPPNTIDWSMLAPQMMAAESSDLSVPTKTSQGKLATAANTMPLFRHSWIENIPLVGQFFTLLINAGRYSTTLEQNAELIASDLEMRDSPWIGKAVGVVDRSK